MSQLLLAAELGNAGRAVVLPNREPKRPSGAASPRSRHLSAPPRQPLHCEVLISEAIITPGPDPGQTSAPARLPVRDELERETRATPARPDTIVAAGSAPLERLPVISHRPHPAARGHAHPPVRIQRRRPDHRHRPTTPATRPSNSSPGWCQPTSPPPRRLVTPQTTPALTDPAAWRPAPMASPARATHTGSPRRQARPPRGSQQGSARHRRRRLKDVTIPHKSSATSSNRYMGGRSAHSSGTDDQAPGPVNTRRYVAAWAVPPRGDVTLSSKAAAFH